MYAHSNELEEKGIVNLNGVNIESNPDMETLLGVRCHLIYCPMIQTDLIMW